MKSGTDNVLFGAWLDCAGVTNIIDAGAGSGLLSLMMAQRFPATKIIAVEPEAASVQELRQNISNSPWFSRLNVIQTKVQQISDELLLQHQMIISNPPFFDEKIRSPHIARDQARFGGHLPPSALMEAAGKLSAPQKLAVLIPVSGMVQWLGEAVKAGLFLNRKTMVCSKEGKAPQRVMLSWSMVPGTVQSDQIILRNGKGEFTNDFKTLTADFYLSW